MYIGQEESKNFYEKVLIPFKIALFAFGLLLGEFFLIWEQIILVIIFCMTMTISFVLLDDERPTIFMGLKISTFIFWPLILGFFLADIIPLFL